MDGGHAPGGFTQQRNVGPASPGSERRRLSGRLISFLLVAGTSSFIAGVYLFGFASNQYVSDFRFSVRQGTPTPMETGSLAQSLTSGTSLLAAALDSQIVVEYIKSHQVLQDLNGRIDFDSIFDTPKADWLSRLDKTEPAEGKLEYWRRMVDPYFDLSTGLVWVRVRSFSPENSQRIAEAVLNLSEALVNRLSARARHDKVAYSEADAARKEDRFRQAESKLAAYRNAHAVLFPELHASENATLDAGLRQQIGQAGAQYDTLHDRGVSTQSPQMRLLQTHENALRSQLASLQSQLTHSTASSGQHAAAGLASTLSGYDEVSVQDQIAQRAYERALTLQQQAEADAAQQQVYLSAFVQPNLPQSSTYPKRWRTWLEIAFASTAVWALGTLIFYGIREHLD